MVGRRGFAADIPVLNIIRGILPLGDHRYAMSKNRNAVIVLCPLFFCFLLPVLDKVPHRIRYTDIDFLIGKDMLHARFQGQFPQRQILLALRDDAVSHCCAAPGSEEIIRHTH